MRHIAMCSSGDGRRRGWAPGCHSAMPAPRRRRSRPERSTPIKCDIMKGGCRQRRMPCALAAGSRSRVRPRAGAASGITLLFYIASDTSRAAASGVYTYIAISRASARLRSMLRFAFGSGGLAGAHLLGRLLVVLHSWRARGCSHSMQYRAPPGSRVVMQRAHHSKHPQRTASSSGPACSHCARATPR